MSPVPSRTYENDLDAYSLPFNCYEVAHPWNVNCAECSLKIFMHCYQESLKIYTPLYVASFIYNRQFDKEHLKRALQSILTSSTFLAINAGTFLASFCVIRLLTGKFTISRTALLPGIVASLLAILVERPARRKQLAVYTCNMASEVLYNSFKFRGKIKPILHFEKLLFAVSAGVYLFLCFGGHAHSQDPVQRMLQFVIGSAEFRQSPARCASASRLFTSREKPHSKALSPADDAKDNGLPPTLSCPHSDQGCLLYVLQGTVQPFVIGWLIRAGFHLFATRSPLTTLRHRGAYKFGAFLASFAGIFRAVSCLLRRSGMSPQVRAGVAGCLAGLSMFFNGSSSIALYLAWKALEGSYSAYAIAIPGATEVLYSLSTAILFYAAVFEPHNLRPTYWAFMNRISYGRFYYVNRKVLDMFGVQSSKLFGNYWPRLNLEHVSKDLVERCLIWVPS